MPPNTSPPQAKPGNETARRPRVAPLPGLVPSISLLLSGALIGFLLSRDGLDAAARQATVSPYQKLAVFARVLSYIETEYVDDVSRELVIEEAVRGLLRRLDPHTQFFTATQVKQLKTALTGQYTGVGLTLSRRKGQVVVQNAEPGSPAARAGIRPGDLLLSVDGSSVLPLDLAAITLRLRGQRGTRVEVEIRPFGSSQPQKHALVRDSLRNADVLVAALPRGMGYVAIRRFSHGVTRQVRAAISDLRRSHGGRLSGLVLDLRDNPGGLMDEGIRLADVFLSQGLIVSKVGKRGRLQERELAHRKDTESSLRLVALINRGTASAAEIVAASLADHGRATIVGERSFGKGSMQSIIPLPDGSQLKLTIARYFRPSGKPIEGVGVTPSRLVSTGGRGLPPPPADALSSPGKRLTVPGQIPPWVQADPALGQALQLLSSSSPS